MIRPTFKAWLLTHCSEDSVIGNVARDVSTDLLIGCLSRRIQSYTGMVLHIGTAHGGGPTGMWRALAAANITYLTEQGRISPAQADQALRAFDVTVEVLLT